MWLGPHCRLVPQSRWLGPRRFVGTVVLLHRSLAQRKSAVQQRKSLAPAGCTVAPGCTPPAAAGCTPPVVLLRRSLVRRTSAVQQRRSPVVQAGCTQSPVVLLHRSLARRTSAAQRRSPVVPAGRTPPAAVGRTPPVVLLRKSLAQRKSL